jgi:hypothetical protein
MNQIEMRLRGPKAELDLWVWFLREMDKKGLITLLSASDFRPDTRKGFPLGGRVYVKIQLNISTGDR